MYFRKHLSHLRVHADDQADVDKATGAGETSKSKGRVAVVITVTKDPDFTKKSGDPNQVLPLVFE